MPNFIPFRGLRYARALREDLGRVIAPPYDVITGERRRILAARHANNIVHLDLPEAGDREGAHQTAARLLRDWTAAAILQRDETPAFYLCEQRFRLADGTEQVRRGLFGRLRLERFEDGIVIPHERTLEAPRRDRERLLDATRTHLSPVFLLHPDAGGVVSAALERLSPACEFDAAQDDDGTAIRVARVSDPGEMSLIEERLQKEAWALIADGHHRYESALAHRDRRRAAGHHDADYVLAFLCSLEDPGLSVLPIHRVIHSLASFGAADLRRSLEATFRLQRFEDAGRLTEAVRAGRGEPGVFGLVFAAGSAGGACWLAKWKENAGCDRPPLVNLPPPLRRLDVILLHRLLLEEALGITPEAQAQQTHLEYVKDDATRFRRMEDGGAQLGVLLNPTPIDQVVEVTRARLRLPQKTTYFYPKVPTGLVLDPMAG